MQATKFHRVPFTVEAFQVTPNNMEFLEAWCQGQIVRGGNAPFIRVPVDRPKNRRATEAHIGMWIVVLVVNNENSYKVYKDQWMQTDFISDDDLRNIVCCDHHCTGAAANNNVRKLTYPGVTPLSVFNKQRSA